MNRIDSLVEEHATLRRLAERIERSLGPQTGVGWDDLAAGELTGFCEAQRLFSDVIREHEEREERVIDDLLRSRADDRAELAPVIEGAHASLNALMALLGTVSGVCDGTHVHAVRSIAQRLREELEIHLAYEEKVLFPLLRRSRAGSTGGCHAQR